jgi:hypothetical protein
VPYFLDGFLLYLLSVADPTEGEIL